MEHFPKKILSEDKNQIIDWDWPNVQKIVVTNKLPLMLTFIALHCNLSLNL